MKLRILLPCLATIGAAVLAGAWALRSFERTSATTDRASASNLVDNLVREGLADQVAIMTATLEAVVRNPELEATLLDRNRDAAIQRATPLFQALQRKLKIDHFYFHLPDRINLARVHEPDHHGDRIDRVTLREAQRTGRQSSGIEQGPTGNCTLRVVYPWMRNGVTIGYVELGTEFEAVAQRVRDTVGIDLLLLVDKKRLDRQRWEQRNKKLGRQTNWSQFPDWVAIDKTIAGIPSALEERLATGTPIAEDEVVLVSNGRFEATALPFRDVNGDALGQLVALRNIEKVNPMPVARMIVAPAIVTALLANVLFALSLVAGRGT